jgi:hypothetical protein
MRRAWDARDERNGPAGGRRPVIFEPDRLRGPVPAAAAKDVMMRPKPTTAVALAGTLLAAPAALAAEADDPPSPLRTALRAPVAGHLTVAAQMRAEARANRQQDLSRRAVRLARRVADARGTRFDEAAERSRLRGEAPDEIQERMRELRRDLDEAQAPADLDEAQASAASPTLEAIAACESGGDPTTDTGNGFYGKYQFDLPTWQSVGGSGNPAQASEAEQDRRAALPNDQARPSHSPVSGR